MILKFNNNFSLENINLKVFVEGAAEAMGGARNALKGICSFKERAREVELAKLRLQRRKKTRRECPGAFSSNSVGHKVHIAACDTQGKGEGKPLHVVIPEGIPEVNVSVGCGEKARVQKSED